MPGMMRVKQEHAFRASGCSCRRLPTCRSSVRNALVLTFLRDAAGVGGTWKADPSGVPVANRGAAGRQHARHQEHHPPKGHCRHGTFPPLLTMQTSLTNEVLFGLTVRNRIQALESQALNVPEASKSTGLTALQSQNLYLMLRVRSANPVTRHTCFLLTAIILFGLLLRVFLQGQSQGTPASC